MRVARFRHLLVLLLSVLGLQPVAGQDAVKPLSATVKSANYTVVSYLGQESAQDIANLMQELLAQYNTLFFSNLSRITSPLDVIIYTTKEDFQKNMKEKFPFASYQDFVCLNFDDDSTNLLVGWQKDDFVQQLAFQGFFQFIWTMIPYPPPWLELGLAYSFWNSRWDGKKLQQNSTTIFVETVQELWKSRPLDLGQLLIKTESELTDSLSVECWALAAFLERSENPTYNRLLGSILSSLDPQSSSAENSQKILALIQNFKPLDQVANDCMAFWNAQPSFSGLTTQAIEQIKAQNLAQAQELLEKALAIKQDFQTLYYTGLVNYKLRNYDQAEVYYAQAAQEVSTYPGLIPYARGLAYFGRKEWTKAKEFLSLAVQENPEEFTQLTQPVLDLLK